MKKIRSRFDISRLALVNDRGMITTSRIRADLEPARQDWISAHKPTDIRKLLVSHADDKEKALLCPDGLRPDAVAEIGSPAFPGDRLMVCLNLRLREEWVRKREALLSATEEMLERIALAVTGPGSRLRGSERINCRIGQDINRRKMGTHFEVTDNSVSWHPQREQIATEARLDSIYVVRTCIETASRGNQEAVEAFKSLSRVEQAFRVMKLARLSVRPT